MINLFKVVSGMENSVSEWRDYHSQILGLLIAIFCDFLQTLRASSDLKQGERKLPQSSHFIYNIRYSVCLALPDSLLNGC
jgi:hypothetical protein